MGEWCRRILGRIPVDQTRAAGTAQRHAVTIGIDQVKHLRRVVRNWTRLAHRTSEFPQRRSTLGATITTVGAAVPRHDTYQRLLLPAAALVFAMGCGPRAHIPVRPIDLRGALGPADSGAMLARSLAPVLYLQRDERFPLSRVVAVLSQTQPIIAYHLLWRDDVNGSWIPFTVATDQEIVWVGYDKSGAPTDIWTYWHGTILHTPWNKSTPAVDVQWGKHGSLPRGIVESSLPSPKKLNFFFAATRFLVPDQLLGRMNRSGPVIFGHSYRRYRDFSRVMTTADKLDAIARTDDPDEILRSVFGKYSRKPPWPKKLK